MKTRTMQREEYERASAEECRRFFECLKEIERSPETPLAGWGAQKQSVTAVRAEELRTWRFGKGLLRQIADGELVVLGLADTLRMPGLEPGAAE